MASMVRKTGASRGGGGGSAGAGRGRMTKSVQGGGGRGRRAGEPRRLLRPAPSATEASSVLMASSADACRPQPAGVDDEGVPRLPGPDLVGRPVALRVAFVVAVPAVRRRLDHGRAPRRPESPGPTSSWRSRSPRRRCRRPPRSRRRSRRPVCSSGAACWLDAGENSAYPLFSQKKITGRCHTAARFTASWNAPWATAPSPKNATATVAVGAELGGRGCSDRDRQAGGHDPVGAEDPDVRVGDVHRAAAAPVGALVLPHQLGEHPEGGQALGQAVTVAAMGRRDDVLGSKGPARPDGRRLLTDGQVDEAGHLAVAVQRGYPLLEPPDDAASGDASRAGRCSRTGAATDRPGSTRRCIVLVGTTTGKGDGRTDRDPRFLPRGRRCDGEAGGAHRRRPGAGPACSRTPFRAPVRQVALVARTEEEISAVADALPGPALVFAAT